MNGLRILITNTTLAGRSGTETYVRDLAIRLVRWGHTPIVCTPKAGEIAEEIRRAGAPVVEDLAAVGMPPDIIHGHHHPETMMALLHFPATPAIFVCHDRLAWHDAPPDFPRILRYVAVDENCGDRLLWEHAVPPDRVRVILNTVDTERFRPRLSFPDRPRRALVFSNRAHESPALQAIRQACDAQGIVLDIAGAASGTLCDRPEEILGRYDLVFAKARCALEALAVGAAVVLYEATRLGPLVTTADLEPLRRWNFGRRCLLWPLTLDGVERELARYDAIDAAEVARRVRNAASLDLGVNAFLSLYRDVLSEWDASPAPSHDAELKATAAYLHRLGPYAELRQLRADHVHLESARARLEGERDLLRADTVRRQAREVEHARLHDEIDAERVRLHDDLVAADLRAQHLEIELAAVRRSATFRLRAHLRHVPLLDRCARTLSRRFVSPR